MGIRKEMEHVTCSISIQKSYLVFKILVSESLPLGQLLQPAELTQQWLL
jgi:hypothetical protein